MTEAMDGYLDVNSRWVDQIIRRKMITKVGKCNKKYDRKRDKRQFKKERRIQD
jgi:hypothetical protein